MTIHVIHVMCEFGVEFELQFMRAGQVCIIIPGLGSEPYAIIAHFTCMCAAHVYIVWTMAWEYFR
jgi:hypothetical protein